MDKEEVKRILQIKTTKHDDYLDTMIPLLLDWVPEYCNNPFKGDIPSGVKLFIAKACEHNMNKSGLTRRTMDDVTYAFSLDFPPPLMKYLRPYRRLKFHATR